MDAEAVLQDLIERRRREFHRMQRTREYQRMPLELKGRHAMETATPWLEGASQALVAMGAISQERAQEMLLRGWYDLLHQAGLLTYGDEGEEADFAMEFSKGAIKPLRSLDGRWLQTPLRRVYAFRRRRSDPLGFLTGDRRRERRLDKTLRRLPFPVYGLPSSWTGPRWIGGHGGRDGRITRLTLSHGDPEDGPRLAVEVSADPDDPLDRTEVAKALWSEAERPSPGLTHEAFVRWLAKQERSFQSRHAAWTTVQIPVGGTPLDFDLLVEGSLWVACRRLGAVDVTIHGRNLLPHDVALEQIQNLEPYIEGHRQMMTRMRERHASG